MDIAMLVKNSFEYDARVRREATTLAMAGHHVRVVALAAGDLPAQEHHDGGFDVVRVPRLYGRLAGAAGPSTATPAGSTPSPGWVSRVAASPVAAPLRALLRLANTLVVNHRMTEAAGAPDVVHAHDLNTLWPGRSVARAHGSRLVYDSHELHAHRAGAGRLRGWLHGLAERHLVAEVAAVVTATDTWADMLRSAHGVTDVVVLRNVPTVVTPRPVDVRAAATLPADMPVLLYQGSIQQGRGIEEGMQAVARLPGVGMVVVGYGAHRPELERLANSMGLEGRVRFVGPVPNEDLIDWTAGADVSLCLIQDVGLSYRTSLPNKLFESLMAGTPVLVSDFGEMAQVVRTSGGGRAVDPRDPVAIADAVQELLEPETRTTCSERARRVAVDHLNWECESQRLLDLYDRLSRVG